MLFCYESQGNLVQVEMTVENELHNRRLCGPEDVAGVLHLLILVEAY